MKNRHWNFFIIIELLFYQIAYKHKCIFIVSTVVWIVAYGRVDIRGLLQSAKKRDYMKYVIHMVEKHVTEMSYKVKPTKIFQQTVIFDVEFLSMRDLTYKPGKFRF